MTTLPPLSPRQVPNSRIRRQRWYAIALVLVLPPFTVDLLFGATSIASTMETLGEIAIFGLPALVIRAFARRGGRGFRVVVLLGVAFALTAEFLIVQTSLTPLVGQEPHPGYGRAAGVNWPFLVWAQGYESLWGIAMPIQLAELAFPLHRTSAWLGARASAVLTILFVLGAGAIWYNWTQLGEPATSHQPVYLPPLLTVLCGWVVVLALVLAALLVPPHRYLPARPHSRAAAPAPILAGIAAAGCAFLWFGLTLLWSRWGAWALAVPAFVPLILALILAVVCCLVGRAWVGGPGWSDRHRLAVVTGALVVPMAVGFVTNDLTDPVKAIGKIVLNAMAVLVLALLARKVWRRQAPAAE